MFGHEAAVEAAGGADTGVLPGTEKAVVGGLGFGKNEPKNSERPRITRKGQVSSPKAGSLGFTRVFFLTQMGRRIKGIVLGLGFEVLGKGFGVVFSGGLRLVKMIMVPGFVGFAYVSFLGFEVYIRSVSL